MKPIIIVLTVLLFISTNCTAKSSYQSHYVSVPHLHKVLNQVKRTSNVSQRALSKAFNYYEKNRYKKRLSPNYIAIADYTKTAMEKRLYIINLHSGVVNSHHVAHGKNSGAKGGRVWRSSNTKNTHMTPYGFFKVGVQEGTTYKKKYKYLSIKGLEQSNKKVGEPTRKGGRDILLHTANYVNWAGRSYGCFAIKPQDKWTVFSRLKTALLYSYTGR
ncbi:murein L,D-transpeptidase catalytic domain family protein [bacterium]|nr:murein L,D-transpeptidase catalytic domain family protein [bacterium]MBU1958967.1 murein L,D-transpeptidase catalytic domain family protein [bacterium]